MGKKRNFNTNFPKVRKILIKFMPYRIGWKENPSLPGALRKKNTQGYSPMHKLPRFILVAQVYFCLRQLSNCSHRTILLMLESEEYSYFSDWREWNKISEMYVFL